MLLLLHLFWVRVAALIFMLMFGINFAPALEDVPMAMLRSPMLLPFLIVGTGCGCGAGGGRLRHLGGVDPDAGGQAAS